MGLNPITVTPSPLKTSPLKDLKDLLSEFYFHPDFHVHRFVCEVIAYDNRSQNKFKRGKCCLTCTSEVRARQF